MVMLLEEREALSLAGWQLPHAVEKKASTPQVACVRRLDAIADWWVARGEPRGSLKTPTAGMC
ncbi:hypothetical protein A0E43_18390 [Pectobacterium cacticida]